MLEFLNITFKPNLANKFSRIKLCNTMALPIHLSGSEIWTLRKKDKKQLTSIKTKFFRRTARYTIF